MKTWSVGGGDWETSTVIDASEPSDITNISVVVSEEENHNVVVYSTRSDSQAMGFYIDPWV